MNTTCCHCGKSYIKTNKNISLLCPECYKKAENKEKLDMLGKVMPEVKSQPIAKTDDKKVINHPQRYGGDTEYECIKVLKAWMSPDEYKGFLRGNAIKYICRLGKKDENIQEISKAIWYLEKLKETFEEEL